MKKIISLCLVASLLLITACANKAQQGAGVGALSGALAGSLLSRNKALGAGIGAGVGLLLGYVVGNELDKRDQQQINQTLEYTPSGQTNQWTNPDNGVRYSATPAPAYEQDNRVYRDVTIKATTPDGEVDEVKAQAYREPDGTWRLKQ
jgi:YD repeat-containing protein